MESSPIDVLEITITQLEEEVPAEVRYQVYQKRVQVDKHKAELLGTAAALRPQDPTSPTFQLDLQLYQAAVGSVKDQVANFEASLWAANPQLYEAHLKLQQLQAFKDQLDLLQKPEGAGSPAAKLRAPSITGSAGSMRAPSPSFSPASLSAQRSAVSTTLVQRSAPFYSTVLPSSATPHTPPGRTPTPISPTAIDQGYQLHLPPGSSPGDYAEAHHQGQVLPANMLSLQQHVVSLLTNPSAPRPMPRVPTRMPSPSFPSMTSSLPSMTGSLPSMTGPMQGGGLHASAPSILPLPATDPLAALSAAAAGAAAAIATNLATSPTAAQQQQQQNPLRNSAPNLGTSSTSVASFLSATSQGSSYGPSQPSVPRVPNPGVQKPPLAHVLLKELTTGGFSFTTPHGTVVLDADDVELAKQLAGCEISDESYDARPLQLLLPKDGKKPLDSVNEEGEDRAVLGKLLAQEEGDGMRIQLPDGRQLKVSKDTYHLYQQLSTGTLAELARLVTSPTPSEPPATTVAESSPQPSDSTTSMNSTLGPMSDTFVPPPTSMTFSPARHYSSDTGASSLSASMDSLSKSRLLPPSGPSQASSTGPAPQSTEEWVAASRDMVAGRSKSEDSSVPTPLPRTQSLATSESNSSVRSGTSDEDDGREWRLFQKVVTAEGVTVCEVSGSWPNQKFRWRTLKDMPEKIPSKKSSGSSWFKRTKSTDSRSSDGKH